MMCDIIDCRYTHQQRMFVSYFETTTLNLVKKLSIFLSSRWFDKWDDDGTSNNGYLYTIFLKFCDKMFDALVTCVTTTAPWISNLLKNHVKYTFKEKLQKNIDRAPSSLQYCTLVYSQISPSQELAVNTCIRLWVMRYSIIRNISE